jgi:hypothetical protein
MLLGKQQYDSKSFANLFVGEMARYTLVDVFASNAKKYIINIGCYES